MLNQRIFSVFFPDGKIHLVDSFSADKDFMKKDSLARAFPMCHHLSLKMYEVNWRRARSIYSSFMNWEDPLLCKACVKELIMQQLKAEKLW